LILQKHGGSGCVIVITLGEEEEAHVGFKVRVMNILL
jgi:hypothetical protein